MKLLSRKQADDNQGRNMRDQAGRTAPVFSYYSRRTPEAGHATRFDKTSAVASGDNPTWLRYLPSLVSLALVGVAALYLTTLSASPRINIASDPHQTSVVQSVDVYQSSAKELFESSLLNRSKLTIDTSGLASKFEDEFPELGEVVIAIPLFGRRPIIQTRPADPELILSGNGGSFVIDKDGVPVLKAQQLTSSVRDTLPVIRDDSDTTIELGKQILTSELVAFVSTMQEQFKAKSINVEAYTFPALANELHVRLAGKGYYLKFNTEASARVQTGTFIALEEMLNREGIVPAEYIDLRVEERAYYK